MGEVPVVFQDEQRIARAPDQGIRVGQHAGEEADAGGGARLGPRRCRLGKRRADDSVSEQVHRSKVTLQGWAGQCNFSGG
jgi:hypothetical protein